MSNTDPSSPVDNRLNDQNEKQPQRSNRTLWIMVASFAAPVILAYIIFFFVDVTSFTNRGEILNPLVHISDFELKDAEGTLIPVEKLTYKWRLISFLDKNCNEACMQRLHDSRQIHASLGKNRHRVYRMFVHFEPAGEDLQTLIDSEHKDAIHVYGDSKIISNIIQGSVKDKKAHLRDHVIYIMDPMGNVMMRFTKDQPNKDFLYDLRKLLKASQIG